MHYRPDPNQPTACCIAQLPPGQTTTEVLAEVTCGACQARLLAAAPQPAPGALDWKTYVRLTPAGRVVRDETCRKCKRKARIAAVAPVLDCPNDNAECPECGTRFDLSDWIGARAVVTVDLVDDG